ncbi:MULTISPECIES: hypothetical protein [Pseudomonas]|uniref:hypothetical protein n=1 Tax=Pseudomonas TaxID=286 RepID=UPI00070B6EE8|nr:MULTISPECIES: hypothetical protein [Pseudomonas]WIN08174.1 hypothetical protein QQF68_04790 [Pseudomonas syringae pv. antirrhini str. 126]
MSSEFKHRRSIAFVDEFVDKYTVMAISWNGEERLHVTLGRDSLEVVSEQIVPDENDARKAVLTGGSTVAYRHDVAGLTIPIDVAEDLAIALLKVVKHSKDRASRDPLV